MALVLAVAPMALPSGCAAHAPANAVVPRSATATAPPLVASQCAHVELGASDAPYSSAYPAEGGSDGACDVTTKNLDDAEAKVLASLSASGAAPPFTAWDHKSKPARLDAVQSRLGLTAAQTRSLMEHGFVVLGGPSFGTYAEAFHEIYQSELPLWVSVDSVLHAVYRSNDKLIERIELASLLPKLDKVLEAMHCALPAAAAGYPAETARDVDLYLTVARSLLAGKAVTSVFGVDAEAKQLVSRVMAAQGIEEITLFGRRRMVDFSAYQPRGHYAQRATDSSDDGGSSNTGDISAYFRAATWLSRLELNLVTYDCASSSQGSPEQSPREDRAALALADLMKRGGASDDVAKLDEAWTVLAGRREDVPLGALAAIASEDKLDLRAPDVDARLRARIGHRYPRTARTHYTWEHCSDLPAITTMLGPRIVPDAAVTRPLVHSEVDGRQMLGAMDMAYAFGHDRAKTYLAADLATYPTLGDALERARGIANAPLTGEDLYSEWFGAIRGLSSTPSGTLPSVMRTDSFADLRLSSTVAAFGQLRHNYVLMAAMTYGEAGCEIPDAFVEPAPAMYDGLIEYAARGEHVMKRLGGSAEQVGDEQQYFVRLGKILRLLRAIGQRELENRPLPDEALRFLSMVTEMTFGTRSTGSSPTFTGWYFDMFRARDEALDGADFLADYYTSSDMNEAAYAGVRGVRLGVFVVDSAGGPRVVVGPVADAFEAHEPLPRLDDSKVRQAHAEAPWAKSYTVASASAPPLAIETRVARKEGRADTLTVHAWSTRPLGKVTIALLDHHRRATRSVTLDVGTKPTAFVFSGKALGPEERAERVQGILVKVGEWQAWDTGELSLEFGAAPLIVVDKIGRAWGGMKAPASVVLQRDDGT
ncbi:MAG TPA: DUF3160 domain-containing protein [Polyangiaceae bacterium]|nr:DUF3160 domain-containing protein [Polyangiaceae bacterium]